MPVRNAMEILERYNALSHNRQPAILIEKLIRERQTRELMYLETDPEPGLRRLDLVVELARKFNDEGATSLRDCINRFNEYNDANQDIREEPAHEFDQGKIRLMTMHAAKGLEFPVVILADLARGPNNENPALLIDNSAGDDAEPNIGINLGKGSDFRAGNYQELQENKKTANSLEKTRLLYVAATRARDYLFVSRNRGQRDRNVNAAKIDRYVGGEESSLWSPVPPEWQSLQYQFAPTNQTTQTHNESQDRESWDTESQRRRSKTLLPDLGSHRAVSNRQSMQSRPTLRKNPTTSRFAMKATSQAGAAPQPASAVPSTPRSNAHSKLQTPILPKSPSAKPRITASSKKPTRSND